MGAEERRDQSTALGCVVVEYLGGSAAPSTGGATMQRMIAAYLGVDPEPGTEALLGELHHLGFGVVLPICEPDYWLSWTDWSPGTSLQRSVRAPVDEPVGPRRAFEDVPGVELILVPALGVDRSGHRVGQGGGYYDRFLSRHPQGEQGAVARLGFVYRAEILTAGAVPAEPHDQALDGAFTPDGLLLVGTEGPSV